MLRGERDRAIERWQNDTTDLYARIKVLERELGEAKGELTALKTERLSVTTTLRIAAVITIETLVLIAVVFLAER